MVTVTTQAELAAYFEDKWVRPSRPLVLVVSPVEEIDPTIDGAWTSVCASCADGCLDPETGIVECRVCDSTGLSPHEDTDCKWLIVRPPTDLKRPLHPRWVELLLDRALAAGVPFWFEGWGAWLPCTKERYIFASDDATGNVPYRAFWGPDAGVGLQGWRCGPLPRTPLEVSRGDLAPAAAITTMRRVGFGHAGHLLRGQRWAEIPTGLREDSM